MPNLISDDAAAEMLNEYSKFGPLAIKENDKLEQNYRKHYIDLNEKGWYDLDSRALGLVGFDIPNPQRMDNTILKVRKAYYDYQAVGTRLRYVISESIEMLVMPSMPSRTKNSLRFLAEKSSLADCRAG